MVILERLGKLKKFNYRIGNRTRDLPSYRILLQPTTLPHAQNITVQPLFKHYKKAIYFNSSTVEPEVLPVF
jgi:hypothetical protein